MVAWLVAWIGIETVKLTGGEPLVRRGLVALVRSLRGIPGLREISMTTNGTLLAGHAAALRAAGLTRVNVSLDTTDPSRFADLTRGGDVSRVVAGIEAATAAGLAPVKLNAVLRRSSWRQDVPLLLDYAAARGLEIRFIELMHTGTEAAWAASESIAAAEVLDWLTRQGTVQPLPGPVAAPARRTRVVWRGNELAVGWITPVSCAFCANCERLRLDARGRLLRCLMDPTPLSLRQALAEGDDRAIAAITDYLAGKRPPVAMSSSHAMRAIGG